MHSKQTDESRRFWSALHWLRRARGGIDDRDKLLDFWIALEFLVSGQDVPRVISPEVAETLSEMLRKKAAELGIQDPESTKQRFKEAISQPTLREKFDAFVENAGFHMFIEEKEKDIVWRSLRKARNDLEHGKKDMVIASEDLDVMDQMLSRMIWILANELVH